MYIRIHIPGVAKVLQHFEKLCSVTSLSQVVVHAFLI